MSELVSLGKHAGFRVKGRARVGDAVEASSMEEKVSRGKTIARQSLRRVAC